MQKGYLILDIGTGNARVGITTIDGKLISLQTADVQYHKDSDFPDAVSFHTEGMLKDIRNMIQTVLEESRDIEITAILSTSQREGIVLIDKEGKSIIGFPNVDNRGREWEEEITEFDTVYQKAGRWPVTVFSALKLVGVRERQPELWNQIAAFTSISDWIGYEFTNHLVYETSQASETLLFDIEQGEWSKELCEIFGINQDWLPEVKQSGTILGKVNQQASKYFGVKKGIPFIVGGADTQLAAKNALPEIDDIVIVSGTTTPIVKIVSDYQTDKQARCWANRHVHENEFIIETNAGVSGLNYQRLKKVFFPDKSYEEMEEEVLAIQHPNVIASFGTLVFDKNLPLLKGGFYMDAPVHHEITAADFVYGILFDIASSIKYNFDVLIDISPTSKEYVYGCGGGFKGMVLPQMLADLLGKQIIVKEGYRQASLMGGVIICNDALGEVNNVKESAKIFYPSNENKLRELYQAWYNYRNDINGLNKNKGSGKDYVHSK
ncbi:FGGY-family carbohydrate kinase [Oceanobacillus jeddahense]|uniref:FGGY-family carbohydrate kinase n=1 Tax=Oceanobacillus jeddahense TaxID=1462527 RepID=UPI0006937B6A|nr:FGGY family carbohydrate kinase [Oceanobacillus jeddahense]